ncbi:hypothetical protein [Streptomyces griseosporeus]
MVAFRDQIQAKGKQSMPKGMADHDDAAHEGRASFPRKVADRIAAAGSITLAAVGGGLLLAIMIALVAHGEVAVLGLLIAAPVFGLGIPYLIQHAHDSRAGARVPSAGARRPRPPARPVTGGWRLDAASEKAQTQSEEVAERATELLGAEPTGTPSHESVPAPLSLSLPEGLDRATLLRLRDPVLNMVRTLDDARDYAKLIDEDAVLEDRDYTAVKAAELTPKLGAALAVVTGTERESYTTVETLRNLLDPLDEYRSPYARRAASIQRALRKAQTEFRWSFGTHEGSEGIDGWLTSVRGKAAAASAYFAELPPYLAHAKREIKGVLEGMPPERRMRGLVPLELDHVAAVLRSALQHLPDPADSVPPADLYGSAQAWRDLAESLQQGRRVLHEMSRDFRGADLSELDLAGLHLEGVRWDSQTRWPVNWEESVRAASVRLGPDLYEIRRDLTPSQSHVGSST